MIISSLPGSLPQSIIISLVWTFSRLSELPLKVRIPYGGNTFNLCSKLAGMSRQLAEGKIAPASGRGMPWILTHEEEGRSASSRANPFPSM